MKKPTGFIAICQCGFAVGALDYERTDRQDAGRLLGEWLNRGCTVYPKFDSQWDVTIRACECQTAEAQRREADEPDPDHVCYYCGQDSCDCDML